MSSRQARRFTTALMLMAILAVSRVEGATITFGDIGPGQRIAVTGIESVFDIDVLLAGAVFTTTLNATLFELGNGHSFQASSDVQAFHLAPTCGPHLVAGCDQWFLSVSGQELDADDQPLLDGFTAAFIGFVTFDEFIVNATTAFNIRNTSLLDDGITLPDDALDVRFTSNELAITPVPEPSTLLLVSAGAAFFAASRRRSSRSAPPRRTL